MIKSLRKLFVVGLICSYTQQVVAQQQPAFSQYLFNGMVVNPAYPSMDEFSSATVLARNQWVGMEGAPKTAAFSFYSPINATNTSIGFMAIKDQITIYSQTGFRFNISQKVKMNEKLFLALGLNGGMEQFSEDNTHLGTDDPSFSNNQKYWKSDVGFGLILFSEKFFVGVGAPVFKSFNLGSAANKVEFKRHYYLQAGIVKDISKDVKFRPGLLLRQVTGAGVQLDVSAAFLIKNIVWAGATWRTEKTASVMTQIQVTKNFMLGYSYDFASATHLKGMQTGSHDLMLNYRFAFKKGKTLTPRLF